MFRRHWLRNDEIVAPSHFILYDGKTYTRDHVKILRQGLPDLETETQLCAEKSSDRCEECEAQRAVQYCPRCDVSLCEKCDGDMHVLKKLQQHRRVLIRGALKKHERRVDTVDGLSYSYEEFEEEYGDEAEDRWCESVPLQLRERPPKVANRTRAKVVQESPEEERIDPNDGRAYSKQEFEAEYGGANEWDAALPASAHFQRSGSPDAAEWPGVRPPWSQWHQWSQWHRRL